MARASKIDRLPAEIRELIGKLRRDGRTIEEIKAKLDELDIDVSRSSLGRHTQELDKIMAEIERSRGISEAVIDKLGDEPESRSARLNVELMHSLLTRCLMGGDEPIELDAKEAMFLATAIDKLASASSKDVDRLAKIEKRAMEKARREADEAAATALETAASKGGLSKEKIAALKADFLGMRA